MAEHAHRTDAQDASCCAGHGHGHQHDQDKHRHDNGSCCSYDHAAVPVQPRPFNLVFLRNDGVAFGLLDGLPWQVLTALAVGIAVFRATSMSRANHRAWCRAAGSQGISEQARAAAK